MSAESEQEIHDVAVVGAGATGLAAASALARSGLRVLALGPPAPSAMGRSVALLLGSVRFLEEIGVWASCAGAATPMQRLALIDATDNLFRPPPVTFDCEEIGLDAFGWNIELDVLVRGLEESAAVNPTLHRLPAAVVTCEFEADRVKLGLDDGRTIEARVVVAADGARSGIRTAAGIKAKEWSYPQTALTTIVEHRRPHHETSTEFHTREGPFTLVPMSGNRSAVVWVAAPGTADRLHAYDNDALGRAIEDRAQSMLGAVRIAGPRGLVPLRGLSAERMAAGRAFLVGEAAHVFPPIGAQGLNLGLRDAAELSRLLARALREGVDLTGAAASYERARRSDIRLRTFAVDALDRTLLADMLPTDFARGLGLLALGSIGPLRRFVMRQGLGAG